MASTAITRTTGRSIVWNRCALLLPIAYWSAGSRLERPIPSSSKGKETRPVPLLSCINNNQQGLSPLSQPRPAMRRSTALWGHGHLPLLARARSKDSVEYILQALWRTRRTGLDAADRAVLRDMPQIPSDADADLDPDQIPNLFPHDVLPELQTLLTLLLHKFQPHWQHDALNDQLQLHSPTESPQDSSQSGHKQVNLQLAKDSLDQMLKDMYPIKDQVSNDGSANGNEDIAAGT